MPVLHLENIPEELYQRLEHLAERRRRTPAAEALKLLQEGVVRAEEGEQAKTQSMLDEIRRTRYPLAPGTPDSVDLLREDRAR